MRNWQRCAAVLACTVAALSIAVASEPQLIEREPTLAASLPKEAFAGVGCWTEGARYVATGHSTSIDSLGEAKGKRTEREFAEEDAKARMVAEAARMKEPLFDPDSHDVTSKIEGFQSAATYRLEGRDGLFLVGVVETNKVNVRVSFDPSTARRNAVAAFSSADFTRAARLFATLTQHDVQDAETNAFARASSAHVNLDAGLRGETRTEALKTLVEFYVKRGDAEQALRFSYDLYRESEAPDRALLERLADLSSRTHRLGNAEAFRKEIKQRWPSPAPR